jgi:hypothetical protein
MNKQRFRRENLRNIQKGFYDRLESDAEYAPGVPAAQRMRTVRRPIAALAATAAVLFSLTLGAFATGFDPIAAWQGLFEKETSIEVGEQLVSAGISMDVQSLYTDGERAVVKMTLKDTEGDRLSDNITIVSKDARDYFAYVETASYNAETGETTCIVKLVFNRQYEENEILKFAVDSITTDENVFDGSWSFDIDLDSVGDHISGEMALPEHPDYTNISYTLSSMYLETKITLPDFSLPGETRYIESLGREATVFSTKRFDDKLLPAEISIILKDGTRIDLPVDGDNLFDRYYNAQSGETSAKTQHWLDGSFEPGDVAEIIIFGVSFTV